MQHLSNLKHQAQTHPNHRNQLDHRDHGALQAQQYLLHFHLRLDKSIGHRPLLFCHFFVLNFGVDCLLRIYYFSKLLSLSELSQNLHLPLHVLITFAYAFYILSLHLVLALVRHLYTEFLQ